MILKPLINGPHAGLLAYTDNIMVRFKDDINFYVYNGDWHGSYKRGMISVHTLHNIPVVAALFQRVVEVTNDDRIKYYMCDPIIIPKKDEMEEWGDDIPF